MLRLIIHLRCPLIISFAARCNPLDREDHAITINHSPIANPKPHQSIAAFESLDIVRQRHRIDCELFDLVDDIAVGNAVSLVMFLKTAGLGGGYVFIYTLVGYLMFANKEL